MSLSGLNPRETVTAYQLLLELVKGVQELSKDPKALEKAILEAYALPESEKAKADEARKAIADNNSVLAQQKKILEEISKGTADLDFRQDNLDQTVRDIETKNNDLSKRERGLADGISDFSQRNKDYQADLIKLDTEKKSNIEFSFSLDDREKLLNEREEALKAKEEKLKAIIGGE